ncbi:hypothetical protein DXG01_011924 [Tephrocybe rancida]|nr:hypothetical protein DXG01_011924 [Tephrocybe rancida]
MNRATTTPILPYGQKPGWEFEEIEDELEDRKSIAESCVLIQALRQSRDKWIYSTFPRFSTKARGGKSIDQAPPPHTIQTRGKCDLEIGPHIFPETTFYEVHYLPSQPSSVAIPTYQPPAVGSWQTKTPYGSFTQPSTASAIAPKPFDLEKTSPPLITSLTAVTTITPTLINQVNSAASSNPTLANLLQLAAAGLATPEQLKTLGLLIQSLATSESTQPVPPSLAESPVLPPLPTLPMAAPPVAPVKEFDLVLEFRENPVERWVFPRGLVTCERTTNSPATHALSRTVIKACLPFPKPKPLYHAAPLPEQPPPANSPDDAPQVVTFVMDKTPLAVWDTISRWAGNQENLQQNRAKLEAIKPGEHVYLGYQLSQGSLLSQLQAASSPTFTMKGLKVAAASGARAKRKTTNKPKITAVHAPTDMQNSESTEKQPVAKRRRVHQLERPPAAPIQCVSCKNKDVPLILGGRE